VDGFDQDEDASQLNEGGVVLFGLFASHGDAFEPLDLADEHLDSCARLVKQLWEEPRLILGV
jgi:hypothetical protein